MTITQPPTANLPVYGYQVVRALPHDPRAFTQGLQALDRSAASKGTLQSGGQAKGAQEFGQGLASQQYGNYFNRLLSLAGIGQGAASGTASTAPDWL